MAARKARKTAGRGSSARARSSAKKTSTKKKTAKKATKKAAKKAAKKVVKKAPKKVVKKAPKKAPKKATKKAAKKVVKKAPKKAAKKVVKKAPKKAAARKKLARKAVKKVAKKTPRKVLAKKTVKKAVKKAPKKVVKKAKKVVKKAKKVVKKAKKVVKKAPKKVVKKAPKKVVKKAPKKVVEKAAKKVVEKAPKKVVEKAIPVEPAIPASESVRPAKSVKPKAAPKERGVSSPPGELIAPVKATSKPPKALSEKPAASPKPSKAKASAAAARRTPLMRPPTPPVPPEPPRPSLEERAEQVKKRLESQEYEVRREYDEHLYMSWIHHDSALEGVVYSFQELQLAIDPSITVVPDSSIQPICDEIRRHKAAIDYVIEMADTKKRQPITTDMVKRIYLFLHPEEGDLKTVKYRKDIPQHRLYFHEYAAPDKIAYAVRQVVEWVNDPETRRTRSAVRIAARAHYDLLRSFPFPQDSGKVSRLLMNFLLLRAGYPPAIIHSTERQRYYEALKGAPLSIVHMVEEALENSIASIEKYLDERTTRVRSFIS